MPVASAMNMKAKAPTQKPSIQYGLQNYEKYLMSTLLLQCRIANRCLYSSTYRCDKPYCTRKEHFPGWFCSGWKKSKIHPDYSKCSWITLQSWAENNGRVQRLVSAHDIWHLLRAIALESLPQSWPFTSCGLEHGMHLLAGGITREALKFCVWVHTWSSSFPIMLAATYELIILAQPRTCMQQKITYRPIQLLNASYHQERKSANKYTMPSTSFPHF